MEAPDILVFLKLPFKNLCPCLFKSTLASTRVKHNRTQMGGAQDDLGHTLSLVGGPL